MRRRGHLVALATVVVALTSCGDGGTATSEGSGPGASTTQAAPADEEAAVRAAYDAYVEAVLAMDGEAAVRVIAPSVLGFYDAARNDALVADEATLRAQPVSSQLTVFVLRASFTADQIRSATPEELVVLAIEEGLVGQDSIRGTEVGDVRVNGASARLDVLRDGQPSGFGFDFVQEGGAWRLDLLALIGTADAAFDDLSRQQGVTTDQLVDQVLEARYGAATAEEVLSPIGP